MLDFIKTPTNDIFFSLIVNANNDIVLCAPFIKEDIVAKILEEKNPDSRLTVMTSSNIANFVQGSSDIKAIDRLIKSNVLVRNFQNLHAKIYMFDQDKALIDRKSVV